MPVTSDATASPLVLVGVVTGAGVVHPGDEPHATDGPDPDGGWPHDDGGCVMPAG
jgi:hypothetical protein